MLPLFLALIYTDECELTLVARFAIQAPLDDCKFMAFLFPLPGAHHDPYRFCFLTIARIFRYRGASRTEFANPKFMNPNHMSARIGCTYGIIPPAWRQSDALVPVDFDGESIFLPGDSRPDFFRWCIGFTDFGEHVQDLLVDVVLVSNETRQRLNEQEPPLRFGQLTKQLGNIWKDVSDVEKAKAKKSFGRRAAWINETMHTRDSSRSASVRV